MLQSFDEQWGRTESLWSRTEENAGKPGQSWRTTEDSLIKNETAWDLGRW